MALAAGTKLGPYEMQSPLGAGGRAKSIGLATPNSAAKSLSKFLRLNFRAIQSAWHVSHAKRRFLPL